MDCKDILYLKNYFQKIIDLGLLVIFLLKTKKYPRNNLITPIVKYL